MEATEIIVCVLGLVGFFLFLLLAKDTDALSVLPFLLSFVSTSQHAMITNNGVGTLFFLIKMIKNIFFLWLNTSI